MSRIMISPHDRTDGVQTSKGSAGTNATADALEADRQRNMPAGLLGRRHEPTPRTPIAIARARFGHRICPDCGQQFGQMGGRQVRCDTCQARRSQAIRATWSRKASLKAKLRKRSESRSRRTVR